MLVAFLLPKVRSLGFELFGSVIFSVLIIISCKFCPFSIELNSLLIMTSHISLSFLLIYLTLRKGSWLCYRHTSIYYCFLFYELKPPLFNQTFYRALPIIIRVLSVSSNIHILRIWSYILFNILERKIYGLGLNENATSKTRLTVNLSRVEVVPCQKLVWNP